MNGSLRVLLTAPNIHPDATGEEFVAWRWAEALSHEVELTVFTFQRDNRRALAETLPQARVLTEPMPRLFARSARFEAMAKPHYPLYTRAVRQLLAREPASFDIIHQIMPQAARYPSPLRHSTVPYVLGPLGGTLETPPSFSKEAQGAVWYTRLRGVDRWRFRFDPWLRASYANASLVLGVAPYMREVLADIPIRRFEPVLELGVTDLPQLPDRAGVKKGLRLLHVGRGVRTKGLRDVVRAMGHLKETLPDLTLTSAGAGEEIEVCRREATALGIADRVRFLGLIPRHEVEALYAEADLFVFPSFREPAGNVIYEAMRWGLPVIVAARGGPEWIVDDTVGLRIPVTNPHQFPQDIANAIEALAASPERRAAMGAAGRAKLEREGLWPAKAAALTALYRDVLKTKGGKNA